MTHSRAGLGKLRIRAKSQSLLASARHATLLISSILVALPSITWAQSDPEELILTVAEARDLADTALREAQTQVGALLVQIGPSCVHAAGRKGFGHWSLAAGASGSRLDITNPDYDAADPRGADRFQSPIAALYADLSLGLLPGCRWGSLLNVGSLDLLLRSGFTLGDQENITGEIDFGSLKPIFGAGGRLGLLRGRCLPFLSCAAGVNYLQARSFAVQGMRKGKDFEVRLDFKQRTSFLLLELGKNLSRMTAYLVWGQAWHRLEADYFGEIVYAEEGENLDPAEITADFSYDARKGLFFGGLEFGAKHLRFALELGSAGNEAFGTIGLRYTR